MKKTTFAFLLIVAFSVISFGQTKADLINADEKFTKDGIIEVRESPKQKIEKGVYDGVKYSIKYSDSSAVFEGKENGDINETNEVWKISCRVDPIDDKKMCLITFNSLLVIISDRNLNAVAIVKNVTYGSNSAIRVDKNEAVTGGVRGMFVAANADKIIGQLKTGKQVVIRYTEVGATSQIESISIYGFNAAFEYAKWAIAKIK